MPYFSKNKITENLEKDEKGKENGNEEVNINSNNNNNNSNIPESEDEKIIAEMVKGLNYVTKDRVVKVQVAAEEALALYENLKNQQNGKRHNKRKVSKLNLLRNLSKINKEKNNVMPSKEVRKEIYNIGMGKFLRSNDYLNNRDEENLLELKKELNRSKSKSKSKE
jgi:glutathione peroxidase-family protein